MGKPLLTHADQHVKTCQVINIQKNTGTWIIFPLDFCIRSFVCVLSSSSSSGSSGQPDLNSTAFPVILFDYVHAGRLIS